MKWIAVSESLPAYGERVLVTDGAEIGHVFRDRTDGDGDHWRMVDADGWDETDYFCDVTHWTGEPDLPDGTRPKARGPAR